MSACPETLSAFPGWQAQLDLRFGVDAKQRTRVVHKRHHGPLRLLKAYAYPDGACEAVIVHPPGGLVGGDRLALNLELEAGARVLCTTPGAQKWYRTQGRPAQAQTVLQLGSGASLEWLPQPAIVFDRAQMQQTLEIELAADARLIGWECLVLGRAAMGERFTQGALQQAWYLRRAGALIGSEHLAAQAGDRVFDSPLGWGGRTVACTLWLAGPDDAVTHGLRDQSRALLTGFAQSSAARAARLAAGLSVVVPGLMVARIVADDAEPVMQVAQQLWHHARPALLGAAATPPRIWAT